jgi:hypothetical protein
VKRVAEIVESDVVALQLNRVARGSGTDKILRRFWDEDSAREWLLHGDPETAYERVSGNDPRPQHGARAEPAPAPSPSRPDVRVPDAASSNR